MAGSIQGDINQALGTLGALAQFSPQLKERAENRAESRRIEKEEKALKEQTDAINSTGREIKPQIEEDIKERTRDLAKRKFELNPSKETYSEYSKTLPDKPFKEDPEDAHWERLEAIPDEARRAAEYDYAYKQAYNKELANLDKQQQAMARQDRQKEAKKSQRRIFMNYLKKQPVFGETVGSIDERSPGFAKQLASQYNKSQRKAMMDRMDKEAKKSGK